MNVREPYREKQGSESIWLPIDATLFTSFPADISWEGSRLVKKDEFHVTLLHVQNVCALAGLPFPDPKDRVISLFNTFADKNPIKFVSFRDDFRYVEKGEKKTIVVRCIVSNLGALFLELNRAFDIAMPTQPAHVTLYTLQKNVGIHIESDEVMNSFSIVTLPEFTEALKKVRSV